MARVLFIRIVKSVEEEQQPTCHVHNIIYWMSSKIAHAPAALPRNDSFSRQSDAPRLALKHYDWSLAEKHREGSNYPGACEMIAHFGAQPKRLPLIE